MAADGTAGGDSLPVAADSTMLGDTLLVGFVILAGDKAIKLIITLITSKMVIIF